MNYYSLLIFCGICVTLIPNMGLPGEWKIPMLSVLGVCIAGLAYFAQRTLPDGADDVESVLPEPNITPHSTSAADTERTEETEHHTRTRV